MARAISRNSIAKFDRQLLIGRIVRRELEGDLEHVLGVEGHPRGAVGLLQIAAGRQRRAAVEDADIVEPEKPPFEEVPAEAVFAVHPPAEVRGELAEDPLQEFEVGLAAQRLLHPVGKIVAQPCTGGLTSLKFHS